MNKLASILLFIFVAVGVQAIDVDKLPQLNGYVTDESKFLNSSERNSLENELRLFEQETSNEIAVYISDNLYGMVIEEFAFALGEKNGIGKDGADNGVLIVIKPKTSLEKGRIFIATGYGLEGAIPDALANRIVDLEIIPEFKKGNNYAGIKKGIDVLKQLAQGEIDEKQYMASKKGEGNWLGVLMILLIIAIVFISNASKARRYGRRNNLPFWAAMAMLNSSSGSSSSGFSNFSSGSGSFGGFGGGSFGGGGAGGSW